MGKYLARGHGVRTERSEGPCAITRGPNIFLSVPTYTQSISILSYGLFILFMSTQKMKLGQNKKRKFAQKNIS